MARHLERFGIDAILVTEPQSTGYRLLAALSDTPGVLEASAGACSVLLRFTDWAAASAAIPALRAAELMGPADSAERIEATGTVIEIPVTYDGEDLHAIATECGLTVRQVMDLHSSAIYVVSFCGFAPGFAYLEGLPARLRVRRLESPRARVPAGAVAIADTWCGIYPRATPGGWRIIGRTALPMFDPHASPPALLAPGHQVRFIPEHP